MNQFGLPDDISNYENYTTEECLRQIKTVNKKMDKFDKVQSIYSTLNMFWQNF
jgi:hypothetical protein